MTKKTRHQGIEERIGKDGQVSYRVKVRLKGYPPQSETCKRLTDAVRRRQEILTDIRRGRYFQTSESRKHTFGELVDRYIKTVLPRKPAIEKKQATQMLWWKITTILDKAQLLCKQSSQQRIHYANSRN